MKYRNSFLFILLFSVHLSCHALSGVSIAAGSGMPNNLEGTRVSFFWNWSNDWFKNRALTMTGFWDVSMAYWGSDGDRFGQHRNLVTFAAAPALRILPNHRLGWPVTPYLEFSIGIAVHTAKHLGGRDLGSHFAFQDLMGAGLLFGKSRRFSLSYHYLHYSNANLFPPNRGIDVKQLFRLAYRFD